MKKKFILLFASFFFVTLSIGQDSFNFAPPTDGPGSATYAHDELAQYDFGKKQTGYWLFQPAAPRPDSANVIVFNHGYGVMNPMIYGQWIRHLVRQGNIVIYPRYQKNLFVPFARKFPKNTAKAIRNALNEMREGDYVKPIIENLAMVGHSYGGVISANLTINFEKYDIPKPTVVMLCSPGSGPLRGAVLKSYEDMPADTKLIVMIAEHDRVVGDKFGKKVYETATQVTQRNLIEQFHDTSIKPNHRAGHNESYALDKSLDNGKRNVTTKRGLRTAQTNNVDYFGYWKIFDAMRACNQSGEYCEYAFGNTPEQRSLGVQPDGKPLLELKVTVPPMIENTAVSSH